MTYKNQSLKHWIVLVLACGLIGGSFGIGINAAGVFYTPVSESLGVLRGSFALSTTLYLISMSIVSLIVPRALRRYRYKHILMVSVSVSGLATFLLGSATNMMMFHLLSIIRGMGHAFFAMVPMTMLVNAWFKKHHGVATALVLGFSGIAGAIFSPLFTSIIGSMGWQMAYRVSAILSIALSLPAILVPFRLNPKDEGLLPYGAMEADMVRLVNVKMASSFNLKQLSFVLFLVFAVMLTMITGVPQHFPGFAQSLDFSAAVGATMLSAAMFGNIFFKLFFGFLSDRFGVIKTMLFIMTLNAISMVLLLSIPNPVVFTLGAFLFGSCYSMGAVGVSILTKDFFGLENYGKTFPVISLLAGMGGASAITLVGFVYDFTGSYNYVFIFSLGFIVIGLILLVLIIYLLKRKSKNSVSIPMHVHPSNS